MDIPATTPVEVAPIEAKVYDKWIIDRLYFNGDGVTQPLRGEAFFKLGCKKPDGTWEFHPEIVKNLYISDIWAKAAEDAEMAATMQSVVTLLIRLGTEASVL